MVRFVLVVLVAWWSPAGAAWAQSQKAAVCGGGCGGGCGPCNGGGNGGATSAPAQPSAMLRNRKQILEGRGVKVYDRCVADFGKAKLDDAVDECRQAVSTYADAFGSPTSARGREASQALAAAENARAAELFRRGRCEAAAALFRAASVHDPDTGAYRRNATLFTASACAAAAGARRRSDLAIAPPPPPPTTFAAATPIALAPGTPITGAALQAARDAFHQGSPLAGRIAIATAADRVPGLAIAAQINDAAEIRKGFNQLARNLVDEATGAMTEAASLGPGGDGSMAHVVAAPDRMAHMVNQYVSDELVGILWKNTGTWLIGHAIP